MRRPARDRARRILLSLLRGTAHGEHGFGGDRRPQARSAEDGEGGHLFISSSEQLYVTVFGKADTFTLYFASVAGAMAVAALTNARLVERWGMRRLSHGALIALVAVNLSLVLLLWRWESFWIFHLGMMLSFFCFAFLGANFNSLAMEPLGKIAGTASAALGFVSTVLAGLLGALVGQQFDGTAMPVTLGFAALGVGALGIVLVTERGGLFGGD